MTFEHLNTDFPSELDHPMKTISKSIIMPKQVKVSKNFLFFNIFENLSKRLAFLQIIAYSRSFCRKWFQINFLYIVCYMNLLIYEYYYTVCHSRGIYCSIRNSFRIYTSYICSLLVDSISKRKYGEVYHTKEYNWNSVSSLIQLRKSLILYR